MTTAHRPTWKAAVGKANEGGWSTPSSQRSALDAAAHTRLKLRTELLQQQQQQQQPSSSERQQDRTSQRSVARLESLKALQDAEAQINDAASITQQRRRLLKPAPPTDEEQEASRMRLLKQTAEVDTDRIQQKYNDSDIEIDDDDDNGSTHKNDSSRKKKKQATVDPEEDESDLDRDSDDDDDDNDDDDDDDDDDDSDDEDDEAALQAELAKIRAEREQAQQRAQQAAVAVEQAELEEAALLGNPLLQMGSAAADSVLSGGIVKKRRWNDDVVFRNQTKGEPKPQKRFVNDTVRNDFHKRFLNKFIR